MRLQEAAAKAIRTVSCLLKKDAAVSKVLALLLEVSSEVMRMFAAGKAQQTTTTTTTKLYESWILQKKKERALRFSKQTALSQQDSATNLQSEERHVK